MLRLSVYLLDTNIISEIRKKQKANISVKKFFKRAIDENANIYISVITIGELRRGIELIRNRKDTRQANQLEKWLNSALIRKEKNAAKGILKHITTDKRISDEESLQSTLNDRQKGSL